MRSSLPTIGLLFIGGALVVACDNSASLTPDAGGEEDGGVLPPTDAGRDGGGDRGDAGRDGGSTPDSGTPGCTSGCDWVELALGLSFSCARRENGDVACWGRAENGELGDGVERHTPGCPIEGAADEDCSARPTFAALPGPASQVSAHGGVSACALVNDGEPWCWGRESFNIGGVPAEDRLAPERFLMLSGIAHVSDSFLMICFLDRDGTPLCAGDNGAGQSGTGTRNPTIFTPMQVVRRNEGMPTETEPLEGVLELRTATAFGGFACARTATTVYCWGSDEAGQLGTGDEVHESCTSGLTTFNCTDHAVPIPTASLDGAMVTQLALGSSHACALLADGTVRCWGDNRAGQLGLGDTTQRGEPTEVPGLANVAEIAAGGNHTCARLADGAVRCWGLNHLGQVGDGASAHTTCTLGTDVVDCVHTPTAVRGIADARVLAAGRHHNCVVRETNEVWCWGDNEFLQLGDGPTTRPTPGDRAPRYEPVRVQGL